MGDKPLPSSFDGDYDFYNENIFKRLGRRLKEEPLIPFGMGLTCWALWNAQQSMRTGNSIKTNRFFRYRLYAQGFTLVAMIGGTLYYKADRFHIKEYQKMKAKEKAQEKREQWIKELEIRDKEDQEWREKIGRVQDLQKEEEERLAILEMRQLKKTRGAVAIESKKDSPKSKEQETRVDRITDESTKPVFGEPVAAVENKEQESQPEKKYESILGETEEGGLLGLKQVKKFVQSRAKPTSETVDGKKDEGTGKDGRKND